MSAVVFMCPVCLTESAESFCACCGRHLTVTDLTVPEEKTNGSRRSSLAGSRGASQGGTLHDEEA